MTDDLEDAFHTFTVAERLLFIEGLSAAIMAASTSYERAIASAALLTRIGYPETADSAIRARAVLVTLP